MDDILALAIATGYGCLVLSFACGLLRLMLGPTMVDRVIALDLISFLTVAFIALYALDTGKHVYLDIAAALALVAFLGTIAFARFLLRQKIEDKKP